MCTTPALHFLLHPKKINQSEKRMLSCDCLDKICWLKWSRLHWTIAFEKIDLELILVRWHGNSGLVAFMDVTFICCEPNVLPCYWDVEPSPFCDPSLWCFVTEAFWEKKNTLWLTFQLSKMVLFPCQCGCILHVLQKKPQTKTWKPVQSKICPSTYNAKCCMISL